MNKFKSHFWYNKSQRNGVFFLAFITIILQLLYFFVDFSEEDQTDLNSEEVIRFQQEIDSLKAIQLESRSVGRKPKMYPFNPSFITDFKGYQLGMSTEEIDRLLKHRADGNYINSKKEFQQITKVSDSLLNAISPYFKFPDWVTNKNNEKFTKVKKLKTPTTNKMSINLATANALSVIDGIGSVLGRRIVSYRNKLGGFSFNEQLFEVYGLDKKVANKVLERFIVIDRPIIKKINVNEATFKEVLSIPYIDYQLTKKIFDYRDEVAEIQSLEELKKIDRFPLEKFDRIALYLEAK